MKVKLYVEGLNAWKSRRWSIQGFFQEVVR